MIYLPALLGGMLIGLAATVLLVANGRVAGISGIVDGLFGREVARIFMNAAFVVGLLLGPLLFRASFDTWPQVTVKGSASTAGAGGVARGVRNAAGIRLHQRPWGGRAGKAVAALDCCRDHLSGDGRHNGFCDAAGGSRMKAARIVAALVSGLIFGFGLSLSGMLDPARVRGFLDVTGPWNPSLAFVLGGAVAIAAFGQLVARRLGKPLLGDHFAWPKTHPIDARLVAGSAIFGIGWGLSGLCPGPAIASLTLGLLPIAVFVAAMIGGMLLFRWRFGATTERG